MSVRGFVTQFLVLFVSAIYSCVVHAAQITPNDFTCVADGKPRVASLADAKCTLPNSSDGKKVIGLCNYDTLCFHSAATTGNYLDFDRDGEADDVSVKKLVAHIHNIKEQEPEEKEYNQLTQAEKAEVLSGLFYGRDFRDRFEVIMSETSCEGSIVTEPDGTVRAECPDVEDCKADFTFDIVTEVSSKPPINRNPTLGPGVVGTGAAGGGRSSAEDAE